MKALRAGSEVTLTKHEVAIERLLSSNEKAIGDLRTDFEKLGTTIEVNSRTLLLQIVGLFVATVGVIGALIKFL